jgi:hypothetical protein
MDSANPSTQPRKPSHRWRQFSIRTLLLLVVVASIACSWFAVRMNVAKRQRAAVEAIEKGGGYVIYDYEYDGEGYARKGAKPPGPAWLRDRLGVDFFADVVAVMCLVERGRGAVAKHLADFPKLRSLDLGSMESVTDSDLAEIGKLRHLERVLLSSRNISDVLLVRISHAKNMNYLALPDCSITDAGTEHLRNRTRLQELGLDGCEITDAALANLEDLKELEILSLGQTEISGPGLAHLYKLDQLHYLSLNDTKVIDAGLLHLHSLTNLTELDIGQTCATIDGVDELRRALPGCEIRYSPRKKERAEVSHR